MFFKVQKLLAGNNKGKLLLNSTIGKPNMKFTVLLNDRLTSFPSSVIDVKIKMIFAINIKINIRTKKAKNLYLSFIL